MDFTRSPRTTLHREGESPIDRKIRQLEEASESQSWRVRNLLLQTSLSSHRTSTKPLLNPFTHTPSYQPDSETPKTRYLYEDFLDEMKLREVQGSHHAALTNIQREPLPLSDGMEVFENRQLDQQMQYFKSEEYRKRLEVLAMENSPKAAYPRRNHQVYIKAPSRQPCKPYQMLRNSMGLNVQSRSPRRQAVSPQNRQWRAQEVLPQPSYRHSMRQEAKFQRYELKQEYPCRIEPQQKTVLAPRNLLQQRQPNHDWEVNPLTLWKRQSSEGSLHKQTKEKPCKSLTKLANKKQNYSPSLQPIKTQHSITIHQTRIETYRKQLQFCNRQQQKPKKPAKDKKYNKGYKYAGDLKIGRNKQNKALQSRLSSSSSSPTNVAYEVSFKIDRNPSKPLPNDFKPRAKPVSTYIQSTQTYQPPRKKVPNHAKLVTEPSIPYPERPLQDSQTNSTATRTEGKWHKMSVVSRSKLK